MVMMFLLLVKKKFFLFVDDEVKRVLGRRTGERVAFGRRLGAGLGRLVSLEGERRLEEVCLDSNNQQS